MAADSAPNAMFGGDVVFRVRSYDRFRMKVELEMKNAKLRREYETRGLKNGERSLEHMIELEKLSFRERTTPLNT